MLIQAEPTGTDAITTAKTADTTATTQKSTHTTLLTDGQIA